MTEVQIRAAIAHDQPVLITFMAALQDTERSFHANRTAGADMAETHLAYLQQVVQQQQGCLLVAEQAQGLVGFLVGWVETLDDGDRHVLPPYRQYGYVSDLYIAPDARRQGISQALLNAAIEHFRQLGLITLRLSTLCKNHIARSAYERIGFQPYEITYELPLLQPDCAPQANVDTL